MKDLKVTELSKHYAQQVPVTTFGISYLYVYLGIASSHRRREPPFLALPKSFHLCFMIVIVDIVKLLNQTMKLSSVLPFSSPLFNSTATVSGHWQKITSYSSINN
eukprot:scaffold1882_cov181-Skeletonema_marinoi.AAC.3